MVLQLLITRFFTKVSCVCDTYGNRPHYSTIIPGLANLTLIILFSKMSKFSNKNKNQKYLSDGILGNISFVETG
jgi:hypothetical protein